MKVKIKLCYTKCLGETKGQKNMPIRKMNSYKQLNDMIDMFELEKNQISMIVYSVYCAIFLNELMNESQIEINRANMMLHEKLMKKQTLTKLLMSDKMNTDQNN